MSMASSSFIIASETVPLDQMMRIDLGVMDHLIQLSTLSTQSDTETIAAD